MPLAKASYSGSNLDSKTIHYVSLKRFNGLIESVRYIVGSRFMCVREKNEPFFFFEHKRGVAKDPDAAINIQSVGINYKQDLYKNKIAEQSCE